MSRSTLNVHGLNLVLSTQAMYISVAVLDQRTISSIKVVCERLNLKQIQIIIDHADHSLSSLSLYVLLKKGHKVCFKSMKLEKIGRRNMFQVHLFLLRVVLLLLLLPQIIRPGITVRLKKRIKIFI